MSIEAVWSEFSERLRAFLARRVRDPEDADDLLQEVFLRIHRSKGSLAGSHRLPAWLFQITRNVLIDHIVRRQLVRGIWAGQRAMKAPRRRVLHPRGSGRTKRSWQPA